MENKGWIKLHRKLLSNDLLLDQTALQIFVWLLLVVNSKGEKIFGRIWASKELGIKPTTFYDAVNRLSVKYKIAVIQTDNRKTKITLINWAKYQSSRSSPSYAPTSDRHQTDTYIRIKNKEYIDKEEKILIGSDARQKISLLKTKLKVKNI